MQIVGSLLVFICCAISSVTAQSYQGLEAVKLVNALDGDSVALNHSAEVSLVVIIFTSNYCPYSNKYEDRIKQMFTEFAKQNVDFVLVNPNNGPDDSLDEMKAKVAEAGYTFPYLKDQEQVLTGIMGASRTPEAYLLKPAKNGFELVYHGAIDDNPQADIDVEFSYLRSAIESTLKGEPVEQPEVRVTGCIIKQ